jgi:hypothetical protein
MTDGTPPDRDECIEQAYFYRVFRDRLAANMPAQDILARLPEELLSSTRLPTAVQFLATEMRHSGLLGTGYLRLAHYFTPFQAFVVRQAERDNHKFTMGEALLVLEREATYKAGTPGHAGLFVYQFETLSRNRLGYDEGLAAIGKDPFYPAVWAAYADMVRRQVGVIDFADLVYLRSEAYVAYKRRTEPDYVPPVPPLFGEKDGKIAAASRGRDPLFLFAALQRQLDYPEVPRPRPKDDTASKLLTMEAKFREMEARMRMLESEVRGTFDPTQFGKPDLYKDIKDDG